MPQFLKRHWFLILLCIVMLVGILGWQPLRPLIDHFPKNSVVAGVLFLMALPLRIDAIYNTLRRPAAALLAVGVNMGVLPLLAWAVSPLLGDDLATGLIVAAVVPCTLASAAVWTRLAGGNDAVSLLVTVITNLFCFALTPAWLALLVGQGGESIDFGEMSLKLIVLVVLPLVLAQVLRVFPPVAQAADAHKPRLSILAQLGLLSIVLLGAIHCGEQLDRIDLKLSGLLGQILLMMLLAAAIHLAAWFIGFWSAGRFGIGKAEQLAVAFAGSQKTLMVGLAVALEFSGLAVLPMLAYHFLQLVLDTLLAQRFGK